MASNQFSSPKLSVKKRLFRGTMITFVGMFLLKGTRFILVPLYTRYLTPNEYGLLGFLMPLIAVLTMLSNLGLGASVTYFMFEKRDKPEFYQQTLSTIFLLRLISSIIISTIFLLTGPFLFKIFLGKETISFLPIGIPIIAILLLFPAQQIVLTVYQARELRVRIAGINFLSFLLLFSLLCYQLIWKQSGAIGQIKANALQVVILFFPFVVILWKLIGEKIAFSIHAMKETLFYSIPLLPHTISIWALNLSDRLILAHYAGLETVGYYTFAYTCGMAMQFFVTGMQAVWGPVFFDVRRNMKNASEILGQSASNWSLLLGLIASTGILFTPELVRIIAPAKYWGTSAYVIPVIIGYFFVGLYTFPGLILQQMKKNFLVSMCTMLAAAINITSNLILVPRYGAIAAAWNTALAFGMMALLYFILGMKLNPIKMQWSKVIAAILLILVSSIIAAVEPFILLTFGKFILSGIFAIIIILWGGGLKQTLKKLKAMV